MYFTCLRLARSLPRHTKHTNKWFLQEKIQRKSVFDIIVNISTRCCSTMDVNSMKVVELRSYLASNGLSTKGNKKELLARALECDVANTAEAEVNRHENNSPQSVVDDNQPVKSVPPKAFAEDSVPGDMPEPLERRKRKWENKNQWRKKIAKGPSLPKSPLMLLNELRPGLTFDIVSIAGGINPRFRCTTIVDGIEYREEGNNKKEAKQNVAKAVLSSTMHIEQLPMQEMASPVPHFDVRQIDFTSDDVEFPFPVQQVPFSAPPPTPTAMEFQTSPPPKPEPMETTETNPKRKSPETLQGKNPVMVLNETQPNLQFKCFEEGRSPQTKSFIMEVEMNGKTYRGYGKSKKLAKSGVATKILQEEFGLSTRSPDQKNVLSNLVTSSEDAGNVGNLPDFVYDMVRNKFSELTDNFSTEHSKHKVLAGIVMTRDTGPDVKDGEVISVATGTKCVKGEFISDQGAALFDCHAEIVSRRGLRRFIYHQLIDYERNKASSILEHTESGRFKLKSDVYFHLYINTSPCGDCRLFSPHETEDAGDNHPNRRSRGQLRTKIENGEGTIPVEDGNYVTEKGRSNVQQTWDGIISGERLLTMSCSDKIAKWNIVGLQGSLLSIFMEPVYLSSIVLGSLYHAQHLQRGVFQRAKEAVEAVVQSEGDVVNSIPPNYRIHRPLLASVSSKEQRNAKKAPNFCFHWTSGDISPYIINTGTGRTEESSPSNLCKKEMMKLFVSVCENNKLVKAPDLLYEKTYGELKGLATEYQTLKYQLMGGFMKSGCGRWIGKPNEVDMFTYVPE